MEDSDDTDSRLLTVEQAATYLGLSVSSIRLYIREGTLKALRVAGRRTLRIREADLIRLLEPAKA